MRIDTKSVIAVLFLGAGCDAPPEATTTFHTAVARSPDAGTIFLYPERIPLQDGGLFSAERGIYFAPLNRAHPDGDVIGVEVYRFPASARSQPGAPPIFFLHGGPSFAGLERSLENLGTFEDRWMPLTDVSDVVVVGQRGIGSSKPTTTIETTRVSSSASESDDPERDAEDLRAVLTRGREYWERAGLDLSGFTVLEAAEDVNEVRRALGYDKITIWGGSFGSHWGMNLMRLHPEIVERAILRGMEGPDHTYDHPGHLWNVYRRVAEEAEASTELAGRIPQGGLIAAFEALVARADERPFTVTVTDPADGSRHEVLFDGESLRQLSRGFTTGLAGWPADVIEMAEGNFSRAAQALYARSVRGGRSFGTAAFFQLDCGSGITPERLAEQRADPANAVLYRVNWEYIEGCPAWESDLGDGFRQNFETDIPTVIAHGTWDTSTPYENALELHPFFKNSKFIPVIRGPHGAIRAAMESSDVFRAGILHFAATGDWTQLPDTVVLPPVRFRVPASR
ncbi:MAG: alpha/beta fold hydrolase [Gemmatimonadota bacterium]